MKKYPEERKRMAVEHSINLPEMLEKDKAFKILYTMPETAGDVLLSTAVLPVILEKHPGAHIYFATKPQYFDILKNNSCVFKVIPYDDALLDYIAMSQMFDIPFTPHFYTQKYGNWMLNGHGRHLADVYASACCVDRVDRPSIFAERPGNLTPELNAILDSGHYGVVHTSGRQKPKVYTRWKNVFPHFNMPLIQVGGAEDQVVTELAILATTANQLAWIISHATFFLGTDSFPAHIAGTFNIPSVILYGSTYSSLVKPLFSSYAPKVILEPVRRYSCERPCHLLECHQNKDNPCVNLIEKEDIVVACGKVLTTIGYPEAIRASVINTISAYGIILNGFEQDLPFQAAIDSHLDLADEVVIVDGCSSDGTWEYLLEHYGSNPKVKLSQRQWDFSQPTMFGIQKTAARRECTSDWCWQFDMDEVVHEDDIPKFRSILSSHQGESMFTFGCITFFGSDDAMDITGENPIKWRLTRNLPWVEHGVATQFRKYTEDGLLYMDKRHSDSCEYVRVGDGKIMSSVVPDRLFVNPGLLHFRDLVQKEWREGKSIDHKGQYQYFLNQLVADYPVVYHYSWIDIRRKIFNQTPFWDNMYLNYSGDGKPQSTSRWVKHKEKGDVTLEDLEQVVADFMVKPVVQLTGARHPKYIRGWLETHVGEKRCQI